MNIPYVMKKCSKCGRWLVASKANFHKHKAGKYGLKGQCKECRSEYNKQYEQLNKEKRSEQHKKWYEANPEYNKQYYEANKDKKIEYITQWRKSNRERVLKYNKKYRQNNKDEIKERYKKWLQTPQGQASELNKSYRRRIKKEQQGTGITKDQWLEMMNYFDWRCAYSGKRLTNDIRTVDHIVPLDAGGDHMIWNTVPMARNLNSSKNNKEMLEWYREQDFFSEARLTKIYEWQEYAYNKWGKDTEYFNTNDIQISFTN